VVLSIILAPPNRKGNCQSAFYLASFGMNHYNMKKQGFVYRYTSEGMDTKLIGKT
jgi:hypothetical protein